MPHYVNFGKVAASHIDARISLGCMTEYGTYEERVAAVCPIALLRDLAALYNRQADASEKQAQARKDAIAMQDSAPDKKKAPPKRKR